jgi:uncharacterized protein (TIGR01777 family)
MYGRMVLITGATGFIGRALCRRLIRGGFDIAVLTRDRDRAKRVFGGRAVVVQWDGRTASGWRELASRAEAVVNLAGENIGAGRWTKERKARILESRVQAGRAVVDALRLASPRPRTIIQASAVGFYGPRGDEEIDETSPCGEGFLAETVRAWEESTREAEDLGVRRAIIRSGLVLDKSGGVLPRLSLPFKFFVGGKLGSGEHWISWIHRDDAVEAIYYLLGRRDLAGVFNFVAPGPLRQKQLARSLGRAMKRPAWFPVPGFALKWIFGEMAEETLLSGQRVLPAALLREDFRFRYPEIESALGQIFTKNDVEES